MFNFRCTTLAICFLSCTTLAIDILLGINGISLVDSLEEGAAGNGRSGDGIYGIATLIVLRYVEVAILWSLADDATLSVFLEPGSSLGTQARSL